MEESKAVVASFAPVVGFFNDRFALDLKTTPEIRINLLLDYALNKFFDWKKGDRSRGIRPELTSSQESAELGPAE